MFDSSGSHMWVRDMTSPIQSLASKGPENESSWFLGKKSSWESERRKGKKEKSIKTFSVGSHMKIKYPSFILVVTLSYRGVWRWRLCGLEFSSSRQPSKFNVHSTFTTSLDTVHGSHDEFFTQFSFCYTVAFHIFYFPPLSIFAPFD